MSLAPNCLAVQRAMPTEMGMGNAVTKEPRTRRPRFHARPVAALRPCYAVSGTPGGVSLFSAQGRAVVMADGADFRLEGRADNTAGGAAAALRAGIASIRWCYPF